uniref:Uncharacterized protein n=1 Tax=Pristionchus pacificus TaxID=54126 RepID=A0A2A6BFR9_PRIPA|eukprot:PDM64730.1 hypothetical protein PRIPAC_52986 [Pristionchus pacificus]
MVFLLIVVGTAILSSVQRSPILRFEKEWDEQGRDYSRERDERLNRADPKGSDKIHHCMYSQEKDAENGERKEGKRWGGTSQERS